MSIHTGAVILAVWAAFCICRPASAMREVRIQDPDDAIFSATEVVIVAHAAGDSYKVTDALYGTLRKGEAVSLPGFVMMSVDDFAQKATVVPIEANTRILLFLRPSQKDPKKLEIAEDGSGYFPRDDTQIEALRQIAAKAIAQRQKWEAIVATKPSRDKVEALWPYIDEFRTCGRLTMRELAKMNPLAGDYLAEKLPGFSPEKRAEMMSMWDIRSEKLNTAIVADMAGARRAVDQYLAEQQLDYLGTDLPQSVEKRREEIGAGLWAISEFKDPGDLPMVRDMVPWLIRVHCEGEVEFCTRLLRDCPDKASIPALKAVWQAYRPSPGDAGFASALVDVTDALGAIGGPDAIAILQDMLTSEGPGPYARSALDKIRTKK